MHEHPASSLSSSQSFGASYEGNSQLLEATALAYFGCDIDLTANHTVASSFIAHNEQSGMSSLTNEGELQWALQQLPVDNYSGWGADAMNPTDYY